jgi:hypothetical protein
MTIGDSTEWDGFILNGGVGLVMDLTLDAWRHTIAPAPDEHEDKTSVRLYATMVKKRDRQAHRFLIRYQDVEIDTDLAKVTGKKDIVFFPGHDGDLYFCLEAKRLNARVKGVMKSLADEYVKEGMQRFVTGKYSRHVHHAGMLGYVLDGDVLRAMANVLDNIRRQHVPLGMDAPGDWIESPHRMGDPQAKQTTHRRTHTPTRFQLQHLFVTALAEESADAKKQKSESEQRLAGSNRTIDSDEGER